VNALEDDPLVLAFEHAMAEGVEFMAACGDDFDESDLRQWRAHWGEVLDENLVAKVYEPDDRYERQYLMIALIGMAANESLWATLVLAYEEGDETIAHLAEWAMLNINPMRYGLDRFFKAMAAYVYELHGDVPYQYDLI